MATPKKETLSILTVDTVTGIETVSEFTVDELEQRTKDQAEESARRAEADAKIATRSSALAKLSALGLTPEEIASL
jgi:DNA-binding NarL/FixJ family response regulator